MPATGVCAPDRMLVAVRAMAPVAGSPPNSGEAMLATPWAISSTFGLCRSPVMRSATTADMSDSMAPSIATVRAGEMSCRIRSGRNAGRCTLGSPPGIPPNRLPIVSTGRLARVATIVPPSSAISVGGTRGANRTTAIMVSSDTDASAVAAGEKDPASAARTWTRPRKSPGTCCTAMPKKSLTWVLAMRSAMPFVKPMTTGRGMNRTAVPSPVAPAATSSTPAIIVHMKRPETPCSATMALTTTTNAPVGPPIWYREPPSADIRKPVTIAQ